MTPREKLQLAYELAFFPPRLNELWSAWRDGRLSLDHEVFCGALGDACRLHLALPEAGYASQRALERLAVYQARSRAYGMPRFVRAVRARLGLPDLNETTVPGHLVRDIALPAFTRGGIECGELSPLRTAASSCGQAHGVAAAPSPHS